MNNEIFPIEMGERKKERKEKKIQICTLCNMNGSLCNSYSMKNKNMGEMCERGRENSGGGGAAAAVEV